MAADASGTVPASAASASLSASDAPAALVLGSTSPGRASVLKAAGIAFSQQGSHVDEDAVVAAAAAEAQARLTPAAQAQLLAEAKAADVAQTLRSNPTGSRLVLGCDSVFEFEGVAYGKPHTPQAARERWLSQRGREGVLHSGHCLIDLQTGQKATECVSSTVRFASLTDEELEAYIATGEPLPCAGAFTVDGRAAALIDGIEGDFHAVVGLSPAALRRMLNQLGLPLTLVWPR